MAKKRTSSPGNAKRDKTGKFARGNSGSAGDGDHGAAGDAPDRNPDPGPDSDPVAARPRAKQTAKKKAAAKSRAAGKKKTAAAGSGSRGKAAKKKAKSKKKTTNPGPGTKERPRTAEQKAARRVESDSRLSDQSIAQLQARAKAGDTEAAQLLEERRKAVTDAAEGKQTGGIDGNVCTFQFFADAIGGVTIRTIQRLANDGAVIRSREQAGRLLFGESMVALVKFLMQGGPPHKRATEDARRRKLENDAIIQEMKIAEKAGELVDRTEHEHLCAEIITTARRGLENMRVANHSASSLGDAREKGDRLFSEGLTAIDDVLATMAGMPEDDEGFGDGGD